MVRSEPSFFSKPLIHKLFLGGLAVGSLALSLAGAQPAQRIRGELSDYSRFAVAGNVRPALVNAQDQGAVAGSTPLTRMAIHFSMTPSQNADLLQLLRLQQTRTSTQFHHWLTPEQYGERFGLNTKDMEKITGWLESMGFSNVAPARSRTFVSFDGTAAQVQTAFRTSIHRYLLNGESHIANASAPELPAALNGIVIGIRGLHDFHPKPHARPHFTSNLTGNHFLTPDDFATIYDIKALYGNGITGAGRSIAIPGQTDIIMSDIEAFETAAGLPVKDPQVILTGADPGVLVNTGDLGETDLDLEWSGGIAKGASIIYVSSTDVFQYSVPYAIDNNVADVMPITYGACEAGFGASEMAGLNALFQQAVAQGMTIIAAAGDEGAADCDAPNSPTQIVRTATQGLAVDFPASSPNVTGLGGTEFNEGSGTYWNTTNNANGGSAISYIPEIAWNDTDTSTLIGLEASGGGASAVYPKPSWQTCTGVPSDAARDVPDIALDASPNTDGYLTCSNGSCVNGYRMANTDLNVSGGTSAASPSFGAIVALLDQYTGTRQGNVNQNLYLVASISSETPPFHDITSGNNIVPCRIGTPNCTSGTLGYSTTTGYDQVTGLGTIDAYNLFQVWTSDFLLKPSVTSLTLAPGSSGTVSITVTPYQRFAGNVSFTCSVATALANTTCAIPGTVTGGSGSATLTVTAAANARVPWWDTPRVPTANRGLVLLIGLFLAVAPLAFSRYRKSPALALAYTLLLVLGLSSCGGGNSSVTASIPSGTTTPESGVVTITATSGSLVNTTTVSVTVN